jgi:hypothetical protein
MNKIHELIIIPMSSLFDMFSNKFYVMLRTRAFLILFTLAVVLLALAKTCRCVYCPLFYTYILCTIFSLPNPKPRTDSRGTLSRIVTGMYRVRNSDSHFSVSVSPVCFLCLAEKMQGHLEEYSVV